LTHHSGTAVEPSAVAVASSTGAAAGNRKAKYGVDTFVLLVACNQSFETPSFEM
jgi:hypothetical protein